MLLYKNVVFNSNKFTKQRLRYLSSLIQTPRRALMYVPGDSEKKLEKAFKLNKDGHYVDADSIVMDCEDGVAINKKQIARNTIRQTLDAGKPLKNRSYDLGVRVNSVDTPYFVADVESVLTAKYLPDTVLLPKVEDADQIKYFSDCVKRNCSNPVATFDLIVYVETARSFLNLVDICKTAFECGKSARFAPAALVLGGDDLFASIGATKSDHLNEISYARQKLVLTARAFQLQAIDVVYIKYKDMTGLKKQSEEGARLGYSGKQVIHPDQISIVQSAFSPGQEQIDWARDLLKAFEEHQKEGKGAFEFRGSMIDMPTMKQAENIMKMHILQQNDN